MVGAKPVTTSNPTVYATPGDFCRIFSQEMNGLYLLGLLLTGEETLAEQCFGLSLDDAMSGGPVFKEWARSWARRTVVRTAIRLLSPKPPRSLEIPVRSLASGFDARFETPLNALFEMPAFDRFVFIITVLERMREHECCLWLGCSLRDVVSAKRRVLEALADRSGIRGPSGEFLQPAQVA